VPIQFEGLAGKVQVGFCFYATKKNQADFINLFKDPQTILV
jgi:hypothetical protein